MSTLTKKQATSILTGLGWRIRSNDEYVRVVKRFQRAWNLGKKLEVDGIVGPITSAALRESDARRRAGKPDASEHFSFAEIKCRCGGRYSKCRRIFMPRKTLQMMEKYRAKTGRPLYVVSGCRCSGENARVGGYSKSNHKRGLACDVVPTHSPRTVASWRIATHIGYGSVSRKVKHIDLGSGATRSNPDIFVDGA